MKKLLLTIGLLSTLFFILPASAEAASRYWVGGTGNWDASDTTHWSATSGGSGGSSVPGASDDVTFDASSGGGTVTLTATQSVLSMTGGAHTGTVDFNGQTVTSGYINWSGSGTRTLIFGTANITLTGSASPDIWDLATTTNLTFSGASSTITLTSTGTSFNGGGKTYGTVNMFGGAIAGANTYSTLTITGTAVKTGALTITNNHTITGTLTMNGTSTVNRVLVKSATLGTQITLVTSGATVSTNNIDIRDVVFNNGGASLDLTNGGANLIGNAGNTTITGGGTLTLTTSQTQYWVGDTGSWSTAGEWGTTSGGSGGRVPLPQDDVVFDNNSFSGTGFTVTQDMPRMGRDISWSAVTDSSAPTWSTNTISQTIYGSLTLISGMTFTTGNTGAWYWENRGASTLTSAGQSFSGSAMTFTLQMVGGSMAIQDALSVGSGNFALLNLNRGTLTNPNNSSVTLSSITGNNSNTRSITLGSATWTLTAASNGSPWDFSSPTGLTIDATGSTIAMTDVTTNGKSFAGGGKTYNNLSITSDGTAGTTTFTASNSFTGSWTIGAGGAKSIVLTDGTTQTFTTAQTGLGNGTNVITFTKSGAGAAVNISSTGNNFCWDYLNLTNIVATGTSAFYAGPLTHSTDGGGNTGWNFSACPNTTGRVEFKTDSKLEFGASGKMLFY